MNSLQRWLKYNASTHSSLAKFRLQISRTVLPHGGPVRASDSTAPFTDGKVNTSSYVRSQLVAEFRPSCFCLALLPLAHCLPWFSPLTPTLLFQNKTNPLCPRTFIPVRGRTYSPGELLRELVFTFSHIRTYAQLWFHHTLENCKNVFLPHTQQATGNLLFPQLCYFSSLSVWDWLSTE